MDEGRNGLFLEPVPIPAYTDVVKKPMCLSMILRKVRQGSYTASLHEEGSLPADIDLLESNSALFNGASAQITKLARTLCAEFHRQWAALVTENMLSRKKWGEYLRMLLSRREASRPLPPRMMK